MEGEYFSKITVLYVEDDIEIREELESFFSFRVKELFVAENGSEGLELYKKHQPDIVVTDINMPLMNGIEMLKHIRAIDKNTPVNSSIIFLH